MTFEEMTAEYRKGCSNGDAGECAECTEAFLVAIQHAHDKRVEELLEANSRFEQRGRMAARFVKFMESCLLDGHFGTVRQQMARQLIADYKKDNP